MMPKIRMLLVEDEQMLAEILSDTLADRDFEVQHATNGRQALEMIRTEQFDVVVSDVMMPEMDGFTLVKRLRNEGCTAPVLFLTARSATEDVVRGFEVGGNDFLRKPFAIDELIVRVRALVGRVARSGQAEMHFSIGRIDFSVAEKRLQCGDHQVPLSAREVAVLVRLCRRMGETVEASGLLRELWGDDNFFNLRSLNVYISRLRRHLALDASVEIASERGVGYRLQVRA